MTDIPKKKPKAVNRDGSPRKSNLPPECIGQFKRPEIQAKIRATKERKRAEKLAKKDAVKNGFERSMASEPDAQAALIDRIWKMAMSEDLDIAKFAMKQLNDMGVIKQAAEKPVEEVKVVSKRDPKQLVDFLKSKANDDGE